MSLLKRRENLIPCTLGWTDAVPQSWQLLPCRAIVEEKSVKNENSENQNYLSLMANVGIIPYEEKGDVGNKKPEDLSKCKLVSKGDLVINSMNYGIGSYGLSGLDGVCSPVYIVLKPISSVVHERYALRIFESKSFQQYAQSFGTGILEHRAAIGWDDLKNIKVGIPSLSEQQGLLDYLDRETARIDALITKKTRFIELLREKRQALITHAVTKGLDPNVKMKDSGVEWLGEVPENWEVSTISRFFKIKAGGDLKEEFYSQEKDFEHPYPIYTNSNKVDAVYGFTSKPVFDGNTITVTGRGDIGFAVYRDHQYDAIIRLLVLSPKNGDFCKYSAYFINSILNFFGGSTAVSQLSAEQVAPYLMVRPPECDQVQIVKFLDQECSLIEGLIEKTERSIELLKERRFALISAAVTGQIDLREAVDA